MTSRSDRSALFDAAIRYVERGWPVFPLRPREKVPATRNGFKDATTDLDRVELWWRSLPDANIGLPTGFAFDVLDVDGEVGLDSLRDFLVAHAIPTPYRHPGPLGITGKGWHLLFAVTGSGNGAGLTGPDSKLDFRGKGGYIVAPPSLHPLGYPYRWDTSRGPDTDLPPAPGWLTALLDKTSTAGKAERRKIPVDNATYALLEEGRLVPLDQTPRGIRQRFERPDILTVCATRAQPIALIPKGRYFVGSCPYHDDSTPSFAVYPSNNTFHCYGCGAYGDSYDLMRNTHL